MNDVTRPSNSRQVLHCEECGRCVRVELGLWTPEHVICTECEEKVDAAFEEALHHE